MELRERGEKVNGVKNFSILNRRLIDIEWKLEQQNRKYKELQDKHYQENRDMLAVIFDKLNVLESKIEYADRRGERRDTRTDAIETDMRLIKNILQEKSQNLQGTNSGYANESGDGSSAQVVTVNARGKLCGIICFSLLIKIIA